jgi:hypothetical protein
VNIGVLSDVTVFMHVFISIAPHVASFLSLTITARSATRFL